MPRGGYRLGAGRPKKDDSAKPAKKKGSGLLAATKTYEDPAKFLSDLMNNPLEDIKTRADAAKALMPYLHAKVGEGGKKEKKQEAAQGVAAGGRFQSQRPPHLRAVK
jgi:phage terminase small subunit